MFTKETGFVASRDGQQLKVIEDMLVKRREIKNLLEQLDVWKVWILRVQRRNGGTNMGYS